MGRLLCLLGLHRWRLRHTRTEGGRVMTVLRCDRCGEERDRRIT